MYDTKSAFTDKEYLVAALIISVSIRKEAGAACPGNGFIMISFCFGGDRLIVVREKSSKGYSRFELDLKPYMINGEIADIQGFRSALFAALHTDENPQSTSAAPEDAKLYGKDALLILSFNQAIARIINVPDSNLKSTCAYIRNEFSDVQSAGEPLIGYTVLKRGVRTKLNRMLAYLCGKNIIDKYTSLLAQAGFTVRGVRPALSCLTNAARDSKDLPDGYCVILTIESNECVSLLVNNGEYIYSGSRRLNYDRGTEEFGVEVARGVSALIQFAQSQNITDKVENVVLVDFSDSDAKNTADAVSVINPDVKTLRADDDFSRSLIGMRGAAPAEDPLWLMKKTRDGHELSFGAKTGILIGIILLVITGISCPLLIVKAQRQAQYDSLVSYNSSSSVLEQVAYADRLSALIADLNQRKTSLNLCGDCLLSYPVPYSVVNDELSKCALGLAVVTVTKYDSSSGELTFDATSAMVNDIHDFIGILFDNDNFEVLEYSGYEYLQSSGVWSISVVIRLDPTAGRSGD